MQKRITVRDYENAIFNPKEDTDTEPEVNNYTIVYTISGKEDEQLDDSDNLSKDGYPVLWDIGYEDDDIQVYAEQRDIAYAKKLCYGNNKRYYVKISGSRLFNPLGMEPSNHNKSRMGLEKWEFRPVSQECFNLYIKFLKTKNTSYLRQATRQL